MQISKYIYNISFLLVVFMLAGCWQSETPKQNGLVVMNVLDRALYDDCHIKDSIHMPLDKITQCVDKIDKNAQIVLYCSNYMCATSEYAAKKLRDLGFANVSVYEGGTAEWFQKGLPIEGPGVQKYLSRATKPAIESERSIPVITAEQLAQRMGFRQDNIRT